MRRICEMPKEESSWTKEEMESLMDILIKKYGDDLERMTLLFPHNFIIVGQEMNRAIVRQMNREGI